MSSLVCAVFPGQGAYYPGVLARLAAPEAAAVIDVVDRVAVDRVGGRVSELLRSRQAPSLEEAVAKKNGLLQLAIFAASVASYRALAASGVTPGILMGHSLGEIAALVAAGVFSEEEGASIVCDRTDALALVGADSGYMAALSTDTSRGERIIALVGDERARVAADNQPGQVVISGPTAAIDLAREVAQVLKISSTRLGSAYPFHSPQLVAAAPVLAARVRKYNARPPRVPVFSPITFRRYAAEDDFAASLADHLVLRVRFRDAVLALYEQGARVFVECGGLSALSKSIRRTLSGREASAFALFEGPDSDVGVALQAVATAAANAGSTAQRSSPETNVDALVERALQRRLPELLAAMGIPTGPVHAPVPANGSNGYAGAAIAAHSDHDNSDVRATRAELFTAIAAMYAADLEYPPEVFTETVALEAELGIDSVKQTELLARVSDRFGLSNGEVRLSEFKTLGAIVDFVAQSKTSPLAAPPSPTPPRQAAPSRAPEPPSDRADAVDPARVFEELRALYAEVLEYPPEVFGRDVHLEAELGVDSVKQAELFARVAEHYGLALTDEDIRPTELKTLGKVADRVCALIAPAMPPRRAVAGRR